MTGNHDGYAIHAVGGADSAASVSIAHSRCKPLVRPRLAVRNFEQRLPDFFLKWRAAIVERQIERLALAREIFRELRTKCREPAIRARDQHRVEATLQRFDLRFEHAPVAKLEQAYSIAACARDQGADRRLKPVEMDGAAILDRRGRDAEHLAKRGTEPAFGIKSRFTHGLVHGGSFFDTLECAAQAPGPAVGLKRHAIVFEKITPGARRVDAELLEFTRGQTSARVALNFANQGLHPDGPAP